MTGAAPSRVCFQNSPDTVTSGVPGRPSVRVVSSPIPTVWMSVTKCTPDAVLNSTPNLQLTVGFKAGNAGGYNDLSTTGSVSMTAITGADVSNGAGANAQRGDLVIQREQFIGVEGARQMDQIKLMIRQIGAFPGHKTVLLLSPGFTTTGDPD